MFINTYHSAEDMITLELQSPEEAKLLMAVIDAWVEGLPAAEEATIADGTITSMEQLLDVTSDYSWQATTLKRIREEVKRDYLRDPATG